MATTVQSELESIERQLMELKKRRAELGRSRPREEVKNYEFARAEGGSVRLSELFGDKSDLLLVHNMGNGCAYCTMWADGFESMRPHIESRTAFALVANDDPQTAKEFSTSRGWTFAVLAGKGNTFTEDMGFASKEWGSMPGVSAFHKDADGKIYRTGFAWFGPGDDFCPPWHFFDLLQDGPNGWEPKFSY